MIKNGLRVSLGVAAALAGLELFVAPSVSLERRAAATTLSVPGPGAPGEAASTPALHLSRQDWTGVGVGSLDPAVLGLALDAAACAVRSGAAESPSTLTVIDYSRPSTARRFWVLDLRAKQLLYEELVAHGQGSGGNVATAFSNQPDSHQSSLGLFVTRGTYVGKNGYSLRMEGLDLGFNDKALARAIVMHGAPYVSDEFAAATGRLGRSWGCPALRAGIAREVIDRVKGGSLVFAYYPDQRWLSGSQYLGGCAAAS
jgi:hypothetical protein